MAENQAAHRQHLEKWAVIGGTLLSYIGVACAFILGLYSLYEGANLIRAGYEIGGTIFSGAGLSSLLTAFIYGTRSRREERKKREEKNRAIAERG
jgi:hypothetical protein